MPFLEALKLATSAILSHKLRSFLTLLGVIFGVATVIVVVSLIEGFNAYVDEKIADIGTNAFAVQKYSLEDFASIEALNTARRRNKDITLDDLEALRARGGTIQEVGAKAGSLGDLKFGSTNLFRVQISATTPNIADIERIEAQAGRYFNKSEDDLRRNVCFIGADVAEKLFPTSEPLGQTIRVDGRPYKVIGVGKALGSVFGQPRDMYVSIPLSTFLSAYGSRRSLSISVSSADPQSYQAAIDEATVVMRTRRKLSPGEKENFGIITPKAINELRDKIFPRYKVGLLHGKMKPAEKEKVMSAFVAGEIKILVSTTVIEVGVDVPNASVMIVEHAERFGLSQLHQLRGRVGRGADKSYCVLLTTDKKTVNAEERLGIMAKTNNGFIIAEKDLELRGPGELLGTKQSGLPEFRIGNIVRDQELLEKARHEAEFYLSKEKAAVTVKMIARIKQDPRFGLAAVG